MADVTGVQGVSNYNGSSWEQSRSNLDLTLKSSGQVSADWTSADQTNHNHSSVTLFFDLTSTGGTTPSVSNVKIQGKDPASGSYQDLVDLTSVGSTNGLYVLQVGPGVADSGTILDAAEDVLLPRTWRAQVVVDTADGDETYTFSVGASLVAA